MQILINNSVFNYLEYQGKSVMNRTFSVKVYTFSLKGNHPNVSEYCAIATV